ncbi:hypothetical protein COR50_20810 [Chitinophaga caeni]|uniref:Uncharacterized protein n=1 Tax=Chitinophaga caeni TaxID=2029983 RepID=A0A291QZP0_9BACT|nr:hypothetical protein [Chitinophaga caeni]ATL49420.1 hypothetical protein COR50_20810 [Chitinophaga caeni]
MKEIQALLDVTLPFATELLEKYGEFYPIAAAMQGDGSIMHIGSFDGNEYPTAEKLIEDLKEVFRESTKLIAGVILFDVNVINPEIGEPVDAITAWVESADMDTAFFFYHPYARDEKGQLSFKKGWLAVKEKEVFER